MAIAGLRNTDAVGNPGGLNRPGSWRNMILRLYPYGNQRAPLTALTAAMKSEVTTDPVFHWFSKRKPTRRFKLNAALSGGNASGTQQVMVIDPADVGGGDAFGVKAGDLLMVEHTAELLYVSATPTVNNNITVLRGFEGNVSVAADPAVAGVNPYVKKVGSAFEEGSAPPDPIGWDPTENYNQTQIFREAYALTGSAMATTTRTGDVVRESKQDCFESFTESVEMSFIFGKRRTTVRNNQPLRLTDGILNQLPAARKISVTTYDAGGRLSLATWETLIASLFRYGSSEKVAWCGVTALLAITQMVRLNTQLNWSLGGPSKEYGMDVQRLVTPMGTLVIKIHPLFGEMVGGTTAGTFYPGMDNAMLVLDMANVRYRYLKGRDMQYQPNMQLPGVDGLLAGYLGECGLELHFPDTHLFITGLRGGIKDA